MNHQKKFKSKWTLIRRVVISLLCVLVVTYAGIKIMDLNKYKKEISETKISNLNIVDIKDGTYEGQYDVGYISAKVEVEVKSGKIINIKIVEHKNERGKPAEKIIDDIIDQQKIDVDAVSGATNSSKVIEKAVENALKD